MLYEFAQRPQRSLIAQSTPQVCHGKYLKVGGQGEMWGGTICPLWLGLNDLTKSGWAITHSTHTSPTSLIM